MSILIDFSVTGGELVPDSQLCQKTDLSHLNIKVPTEIPNCLGQDSLLLKLKDNDEPQKLVIDPASLMQENLTGTQEIPDKKAKKLKGKPKIRKGSPKKAKEETIIQNDKTETPAKKSKAEATLKKPKGESGKKLKVKGKEKEEPLLLAELKPLLPEDKYESPFLETKFEPLLEIKSEPPPKKGKAGSKKPKGELPPKKAKGESPVKKPKGEVTSKKVSGESKGKGRPKKEKEVTCMSIKAESVVFQVNGESPLKVANLDVKVEPVVKKAKTETAPKKSKREAGVKKPKITTAKSTPKAATISQKTNIGLVKTNKGDGESLTENVKVENLLLNVKSEPLASSAEPILLSAHEKVLGNKPVQETLSNIQQPSTMPAQTLISKRPDPLSLTSKRPDPLSLTPSRPDPLSLTPTRPDPLSLLLKKPDLSLTSRRPDPLSLLSNRPDPLSLTPTRPDPLSLLNKRPEPLSSGVAKPDPLSEAFSNNKESLTTKDKCSLGSPKLESLAKKSTAVDQSVNQTASKLKPEEASASQDVKTKISGKKDEEAVSSWPKVDLKVDQLASILKSESLLSKAKLDTLGTRMKPIEMLPGKIKEPDNSAGKMKPPQVPVLKAKTSESGNTVKLKPPDLLGGTKVSTFLSLLFILDLLKPFKTDIIFILVQTFLFHRLLGNGAICPINFGRLINISAKELARGSCIFFNKINSDI